MSGPEAATTGPEHSLDPVALEVVRHALAGVAEEMGAALLRAAYSPNIKERADCSAALFDSEGRLVAQAEHIPVHLGAMPASVEAVLAAFGGGLAPGTQVAVNDPYAGGTHLPDLTIVAAVGDDDGHLLGYVANRAHHADVGGSAPGSMPADATDIAAEGLRVPPLVIAEGGEVREDVLGLVAANSRTPGERRGDLRAQLAANHVGAARLRELAEKRGRDGLAAAMDAVRDYSDRRVRAAVAGMPDGTWTAEDDLEVGEGVTIRVAVTIDGESITVDFTGSDPQVPVNCNAPAAVTTSATWFVLRLLTDPEAPPNEGSARCCAVVVEPGTVVGAMFPAPVATGNVETSQKIVDILLDAFARALDDNVPAASQGTMNNLLLGAGAGVPGFSYYETVAGGEGATPERAGMSGVHTGMTNTRNTPVEALELAYPLRVHRAELRRGSGGAGRFRGGDGVVREIEVLVDAVLTLQAERRRTAPPGRAGGEDGKAGRDVIVQADGRREAIPGRTTRQLPAGSRVVMETPGGGGWGAAED